MTYANDTQIGIKGLFCLNVHQPVASVQSDGERDERMHHVTDEAR